MNVSFLREVFIPSLRSGKYPQTQGVLKNSDGYCCLGVFADLALPLVGEEWFSVPIEGAFDGEFLAIRNKETKEGAQQLILTPALAAFAGFTDSGGGMLDDPLWDQAMTPARERLYGSPSVYDSGPEYVSLVELNDYGLTFDEIADVLEAYLDAVEENASES